MRKRHSDRYVALSVFGKLGPVVSNGRVEIEQTPVGQNMKTRRRHAFGGREDLDERVALPGIFGILRHGAAPQVHSEFTCPQNGKRSADLSAVGEILPELFLPVTEPRVQYRNAAH